MSNSNDKLLKAMRLKDRITHVDMSRVNEKCLKCATSWVHQRGRFDSDTPECYNKKTCPHKRSYYRNYQANKKRQTDAHRYLKYRGDRCCLCKSLEGLEVHHIIPQCKGGLDARFNTITLCNDCHKTITAYHSAIGYI